jgi:hypothetical protein
MLAMLNINPITGMAVLKKNKIEYWKLTFSRWLIVI